MVTLLSSRVDWPWSFSEIHFVWNKNKHEKVMSTLNETQKETCSIDTSAILWIKAANV